MTPDTSPDLPVELFAVDRRVVFFPVRHHSPTAARMLRALIVKQHFSAVLVEGPADFTGRMADLSLPHELPIAIYSYRRWGDGTRSGAYYPFCVFSPEWQAIQTGRATGAEVAFIDLPFGDFPPEDRRTNRYADADLRSSDYVKMLAEQLGVDGLDAVWDTIFELEPDLTPEQYLRRGHELCGRIRLLDGGVNGGAYADRVREHFMAGQIRMALSRHVGSVLVVTGGYHSLALYARVHGENKVPEAETTERNPAPTTGVPEERGLALTPYSYARMDALRGYEAGMPNPGFYDSVWHERETGYGQRPTHREFLSEIAAKMRERKQQVSTADLVAARAGAEALARLRGHMQVWRTDLVDGLAAAVIKDELAAGGSHPLLDVVHEVLRGSAQGKLAEGTELPPLVTDLRIKLAALELEPQMKRRTVRLDLLDAGDRLRSVLLHRLRVLSVAGFTRTEGTDFMTRCGMDQVWETWQLEWSPDFDATAIEATRYGADVAEAAATRLAEAAERIDRSAREGAALMVDAALADLHDAAADLHSRVETLIHQDGEFLSVAGALASLLYLYRYDEALGSRGRVEAGELVARAFERGVWLLEILGQMGGEEPQVVDGVRMLLETFERCGELVDLSREELVEVLARVQDDGLQLPMVRGAAMGALWNLRAADAAKVRTTLKLFADPKKFGDFLTGLFGLAREVVQRDRDLLLAVDETLCGYSPEDFLAALPALRLAFTYFTPREKHHLALNLMEAIQAPTSLLMQQIVDPGVADPEVAARAYAYEARIMAAVERYGIRGAAK